MSRLISFVVLIAIIIIIGLLFYKVLIGFFIPVFLAAVLVVVFRPLHRWVLVKTGQRDRLAAALTTLLIMLALFLPVGTVAGAAAMQGLRLIEQNNAATLRLRIYHMRDALGLQMPKYVDELRSVDKEIEKVIIYTDRARVSEKEDELLAGLFAHTAETLEQLKANVQQIEGPRWEPQFDEVIDIAKQAGRPDEGELDASRSAVDLKAKFSELKTNLLGGSLMAIARETANPTTEDIDKFTATAIDYVRPRLLSITGATGSFVIRLIFGSVILVVATFFFIYDGPAMIKTVMYLSPLDDSYERELLLEFDRISRAVVLATILSAIAQGLTAGIGYAVVGMENLTLLIMLTTVFAMVPFVGPAVVWVPVCLYIGLYDERMVAAILLALWGILVVGTVDNLVKAFVLHGQSQLHPLLALLSVLGGVQALGPIGIVVGPMVVAMLQTLLSILQRELVHFEDHRLVLNTTGPSESGTASPRPAASKTDKALQSPQADSQVEQAKAEMSKNDDDGSVVRGRDPRGNSADDEVSE